MNPVTCICDRTSESLFLGFLNTLSCPIIFNSNTIEFTVHTSCYQEKFKNLEKIIERNIISPLLKPKEKTFNQKRLLVRCQLCKIFMVYIFKNCKEKKFITLKVENYKYTKSKEKKLVTFFHVDPDQSISTSISAPNPINGCLTFQSNIKQFQALLCN